MSDAVVSNFLSDRRIVRQSFGKVKSVARVPNLIQVQKESYGSFLQLDIPVDERKNSGLQGVFNSIFPINSHAGDATLEFVQYDFGDPKFDVGECRQRGVNYAAPLRVTIRLIVWDIDEDTKTRDIKSIKEQEVYVGDMPLMTSDGTFIISGIERVIVSQMHRSPGVFFDHDRGKTHSIGKFLYSARIIPYRGSWLDLEFDGKDLLYFRIDRKRKSLVTNLLLAMGMNVQGIYDAFYQSMEFVRRGNKWVVPFVAGDFKGIKLDSDMIDADTSKVIVDAGTKITPRLIKQLTRDGVKSLEVDNSYILGYYIARPILDKQKEVILDCGAVLDEDALYLIQENEISSFSVLKICKDKMSDTYIRDSLYAEKNITTEDALIDIYKIMRPGEPPSLESARSLFTSLFFNQDRYDLSPVGRVKMNARLGLDIDETVQILTHEDVVSVVKKLIKIKDGIGSIDDIDHLGNRRVRSVGELVENQFRIGMVRMERAMVERLSIVDINTVMPYDLINTKLLTSVIREFFGLSQLSQFMDQTNPLSEITHKRRLSALGPGGLTRGRAGFEVRDVHPTHYGRICPIETPEGQNIGLINSMATFASINKYGFIETPYRKVIDGKVTDEVVYLSAMEESKHTISQTNVELNADGSFVDHLVSSRLNGEFIMAPRDTIEYMDVSPMQLVSVATSLIPFLENDDANRALMGSNMQRQAVPLIKTEAPFVGTGMESLVAHDSGAVIVTKRPGIVEQVDSSRVVVNAIDQEGRSLGVDIYSLDKFQRSNYNTCLNHKPLVNIGDRVDGGEIIVDGASTDRGELSLGRNVLIAFMTWNGYNFEDSILISERIVKDDVYTSIHIEEFDVVERDTRLGPEEITRDIPNMNEDSLRHLDEVGIVHIGAQVNAGDILVGKVTPKNESPMTPEEKLLRAIFGEKAADVKDSSLRVPAGVSGTVIEVRVFTRRGIEKDERAIAIERQIIDRLYKDKQDEQDIVTSYIYAQLERLLVDSVFVHGPQSISLKKGDVITYDHLAAISKNLWWKMGVDNGDSMSRIQELEAELKSMLDKLAVSYDKKITKVQSGDDLMQGELKKVKVFIAKKHKLQSGDKMAGRHGNKGVISRIVPEEDMPYLADGTVVDMILNPLGIPSRMNVGQILETHLGAAASALSKKVEHALCEARKTLSYDELRENMRVIYDSQEYVSELDAMSDEDLAHAAHNIAKGGVHYSTPVFDGAKVSDVAIGLKKAGLDCSGQVELYDGKTGRKFDRCVTVGFKYMLKLHHLVDEKIHARSIGPYSLVTQQPLGGKAHFGGQRFGEMECWALQAYGAAYTLQEMLTVKSDDVSGRIKMYESIVRGDQSFDSGIPESFHVMIKELRSLCLNVELERR